MDYKAMNRASDFSAHLIIGFGYTAKCPKADGYIFEFRLEYILIHVV
jgi:hypothetical protein